MPSPRPRRVTRRISASKNKVRTAATRRKVLSRRPAAATKKRILKKNDADATTAPAETRRRSADIATRRLAALERHPDNPILSPLAEHAWEAHQTFNAGALHEGGKVHLVYRSIGRDGLSRFGIRVERERPRRGRSFRNADLFPAIAPKDAKPIPGWYASGGSWAARRIRGSRDSAATSTCSTRGSTMAAFRAWRSPRSGKTIF